MRIKQWKTKIKRNEKLYYQDRVEKKVQKGENEKQSSLQAT